MERVEGVRGAERSPLLAAVSELKILTKDRRTVRFGDVLNYAQIDFVLECQRQLNETGQIRIITLKARQIGISTVIQAILFVLSMMVDDLQSLVVSHEADSAEAILNMNKRYWKTYVFKEFHEETYNGKKHLAWTHESSIQVATAKNVDAGRSKTIQILHASEVAFWDEPDTLMTGLRNSFPTFGLTALFIESTANGVGNYFHKESTRAMLGESEFAFKFYPWWKHPEYDAQYLPEKERGRFQLDKLDAEELRLRKMGVSDSRLIWRRWAIKELSQGDIDKFHQEYPSTPHEAFISTGRNVFPMQRLLDHYVPRRGIVGKLVSIGGRTEFVEVENGPLTIFAKPSDDKDWGVYLAGGDPTHTMAGDYACVQVINRRTLEQVAVYRRKIDPVTFGKDMQQIGVYYNTALLAPEREGPGYATIGCIMGDGYFNVYKTKNVAKTPGHPSGEVYGWSTNGSTKHLAIARVLKAISEPVVYAGDATYGLIIHDLKTLTELRDYVTTPDGSGYCNSDGSLYDDGVMALAVAVAVHGIEPPVAPYEARQPHELPANITNRPVTGRIEGGPVAPDHPDDTPTTPDSPDVGEAPWESWGRQDTD